MRGEHNVKKKGNANSYGHVDRLRTLREQALYKAMAPLTDMYTHTVNNVTLLPCSRIYTDRSKGFWERGNANS